jgi:hypothetical protein
MTMGVPAALPALPTGTRVIPRLLTRAPAATSSQWWVDTGGGGADQALTRDF